MQSFRQMKMHKRMDQPGPGDYQVAGLPMPSGGRFNMSNPKSNIDWQIYRAKHVCVGCVCDTRWSRLADLLTIVLVITGFVVVIVYAMDRSLGQQTIQRHSCLGLEEAALALPTPRHSWTGSSTLLRRSLGHQTTAHQSCQSQEVGASALPTPRHRSSGFSTLGSR